MNPTLTLQQLSPEQAKLCLQVRKFWQQELLSIQNKQSNKILLALSGGADSTAMAVILHLLQRQLGITLCAVTINHKLRDQAKYDVLFVEKICEKLGIELYTRAAEVREFAKQQRIGLEEAGRTLRYSIIEETRIEAGAVQIALAHNADDLCEDVLMRLCRGTGWPGLGGMSAKDEQRKILRPLLQIQRAQIEAFLMSMGIAWQTDETNSDQAYTRNRFRHSIIPQLCKENPSFHLAIKRLWKIAIIDTEFWEDYLKKALIDTPWQKTENEFYTEILLGKRLLDALPQAARLRLLIKAVKEIRKARNNIKADILCSIEKSWAKGIGRKTFTLTKGLSFTINNRNICLRSDKTYAS